MTPEVLVDHKPRALDEPWAIAFPLDHDALVEVDGERHDLPAGAVLVWTGEALDWYPASSKVRAFAIHSVMRWEDLRGGARLWPDALDEAAT